MSSRLEIFHEGDGLVLSATISGCERYRYKLARHWPATGEHGRAEVCFVMLNPSTADARRNDPTILRCMAFARSWGYGGIEVVNFYAWRATDQSELEHVLDPNGPENDAHVQGISQDVVKQGGIVVCAWGRVSDRNPRLRDRRNAVLALLPRPLHVLAFTQDGDPRHPLARGKSYIPSTAKPIPWRTAA